MKILEHSIGCFFMGMIYGWKPLYLLHSKRSIRKYEDALGIRFRDCFEDFTDDSVRLDVVREYLHIVPTNFWKVVSGDTKIERSRNLSPSRFNH